jgi:hypothetical protein
VSLPFYLPTGHISRIGIGNDLLVQLAAHRRGMGDLRGGPKPNPPQVPKDI